MQRWLTVTGHLSPGRNPVDRNRVIGYGSLQANVTGRAARVAGRAACVSGAVRLQRTVCGGGDRCPGVAPGFTPGCGEDVAFSHCERCAGGAVRSPAVTGAGTECNGD